MKVVLLSFSDGSYLRSRFAEGSDPPDSGPLVRHKKEMSGESVQLVTTAVCDLALVLGIPDTDIRIVEGGVSVVSLPSRKRAAVLETDAKTAAAIAAGFELDGKVFSLSTNAQNSLTGMWALRDAPGTFPIDWPTKDGHGSTTLADQAAFEAFFAAAFAVVRTNRSIGAALKTIIAAASTVEAVAAALATDTR
jgi:hypothetical protein